MTSTPVNGTPASSARRLDAPSAAWVRALRSTGPARDEGLASLHVLLLRIARAELHRRGGTLRLAGPELDDLAHQAAADALMAIDRKVGEFRGESRFTTWAYSFVVREVSSKLARHFWRHAPVAIDDDDWDRLPDRLAHGPEHQVQARELVAALRDAVSRILTPHQRLVFTAVVVDNVPLDVLALRLGSTRGAVYKTMFDARRKLRTELVDAGLLDDSDGVAKRSQDD